jgi:hypothetical protein
MLQKAVTLGADMYSSIFLSRIFLPYLIAAVRCFVFGYLLWQLDLLSCTWWTSSPVKELSSPAKVSVYSAQTLRSSRNRSDIHGKKTIRRAMTRVTIASTEKAMSTPDWRHSSWQIGHDRSCRNSHKDDRAICGVEASAITHAQGSVRWTNTTCEQ